MANRIKAESLDACLSRLAISWEEAAHSPATRLLRLAVLRELNRTIHTLRSEQMAGPAGAAEDLARRENFLSTAFDELDLERLSLKEVHEMSASATSRAKAGKPISIPTELESSIGLSKLTRIDRRFEAEITREALAKDWDFWEFEATVAVSDSERFARALADKVWPNAVVLFIESTGFEKTQKPGAASWRGRWILVVDPKCTQAVEHAFQSSQAAEPRSKRLFSKQQAAS